MSWGAVKLLKMDAVNVTSALPVVEPVEPSVSLRVTVSTTCALSALGSLLIIVSSCCFKSLRSAARLILVHLSIVDFGVAVANLVGVLFNFDKYYLEGSYTSSRYPELKDPPETIHVVCNVQAAFAIYCTMGSLLWTNCMGRLHLSADCSPHHVKGSAKNSLGDHC